MRAARSGRRTAPGADAELLDEAIDTCETLLRDLAGAQLAIDAAARRAETSAADWQRERAVDVSVQAAEAMRRAEDIRCRATLVADAVERLRLDLRPSRRATPEHVTSIPGS